MHKFSILRTRERKPCGISGKLEICRGIDDLLGCGSRETRVYKGYFEKSQVVAIKQTYLDRFEIDNNLLEIKKETNNLLDIAQHNVHEANEARLLRQLNHRNVVKYYMMDRDEEYIFAFMALEMCDGTFINYIERSPSHEEKFEQLYIGNERQQRIYKKALLHDVLSGLHYLHGLDIMHGDIKPHNILLRRVKIRADNPVEGLNFEAVLSDFGLGLQMEEGQTSKIAQENMVGSYGWRPKELIEMLENKSKNGVKGTKKMDIFSFGCVVHYVMVEGLRTEKSKRHCKHPFGKLSYRNTNILEQNRWSYISGDPKFRRPSYSKPNLDSLLGDLLVEICILGDDRMRPTTKEVIKNPFFWDDTKMIQFVEDVFNESKSSKNQEIRSLIDNAQRKWSKYHKASFYVKIPEAYKYSIEHIKVQAEKASLDPFKLMNLMRIIRNVRQHYPNILEGTAKLDPTVSRNLCERLGQGTDEDFSKYFLHKVVEVLPVVYLSFVSHPRIGGLKDYYYIDKEKRLEDFKEIIELQWTLLDKMLYEPY